FYTVACDDELGDSREQMRERQSINERQERGDMFEGCHVNQELRRFSSAKKLSIFFDSAKPSSRPSSQTAGHSSLGSRTFPDAVGGFTSIGTVLLGRPN